MAKSIYCFEKDFSKLTKNAIFGKSMENVRNYKNVKLVTTERWINLWPSEPNYDNTIFFTKNSLAREMRKTQTLMNKSVFLGLSILDLSKTLMYEFCHNYVKSKYGEMQNFVIWIRQLHCPCKNRWYLQR